MAMSLQHALPRFLNWTGTDTAGRFYLHIHVRGDFKMFMPRKTWIAAFAFACLSFTAALPASADTGTKNGHVWDVWYARVDEARFDEYLKYLSKIYRHELDGWKKSGLIISYKIITSPAASPDDWNLAILLELENMAALDIPNEKWDAIEKKAIENIEGVDKTKAGRLAMRRVIGKRHVREVLWTE